jgi:hypothetical protein
VLPLDLEKMTLFPYVQKVVHQLYKGAKQASEENGGRVQGPLAYITDALGMDFLDDEWKRALFLGVIMTVAAFFIALFGNLTDPNETPEERERRLEEEKAQEEEEEAERKIKMNRASLRDGIRGDPIEGLDEEPEDAFEDPSKLEKELSDEEEEAAEEAKEETIERWNDLQQKQKPNDGGSMQFAELVDKLRPRWLTSEISTNLKIVSHLYSRLFDDWIQSHSFKSPLALNAMLAGLFFRDYKDAVHFDEGHLDNSTLARAHYYLQFAMASYASDLQSAGILLRSVKRACLGARGQEDPWLRHVLFVDHLTESVVLMFRGTSDFEDMVVDLLAAEVEFMGGVAHKGLLEEARSILSEVGPLLKTTFEECGYSTLVLTGHSLGAGTAVLASLIIRNEVPELVNTKIKVSIWNLEPYS